MTINPKFVNLLKILYTMITKKSNYSIDTANEELDLKIIGHTQDRHCSFVNTWINTNGISSNKQILRKTT